MLMQVEGAPKAYVAAQDERGPARFRLYNPSALSIAGGVAKVSSFAPSEPAPFRRCHLSQLGMGPFNMKLVSHRAHCR